MSAQENVAWLVEFAIDFVKVLEMILFNVRFDALDLLTPSLVVVNVQPLDLVLQEEELLDVHRTLEEDQTNDVACLTFQSIRVIRKSLQVLLQDYLPVDKLDLVHQHDLLGLFNVAEDWVLEEEVFLCLLVPYSNQLETDATEEDLPLCLFLPLLQSFHVIIFF